MLTDVAEGVPDRAWFVAVVDSRKERLVRDQLTQLGYEAFIASKTEVHRWANRQRKTVEQVLISHYVFLHATEEERLQALKLPLIHSFLVNRSAQKTNRGTSPLAVVPSSEINLLRIMLSLADTEIFYSPEDLTVGKLVTLIGYTKETLTAQVVKIPRSRKHYVGVRLTGLGCAYMQVPLDRIQAIL